MKVINNKRQGFRWNKQGQRAVLSAIGCIGFAAYAWGDTNTTLFFDNNGTTAGFGSGTATWNNVATDKHWASSATAGTTVGPWIPASVAAIGTGTVQVSDVISLSGLVFNTGAVGGNNPEITVVGRRAPGRSTSAPTPSPFGPTRARKSSPFQSAAAAT